MALSSFLLRTFSEESYYMKISNQETDKWAWAAPEKFNPDHRKHAFQGALLLIALGVLLTALGVFLAWKFDTWSYEKFTGDTTSELLRRRSHNDIIMLIFNSPWLIGLTMITGGFLALTGKYCRRYDKWKPYKNRKKILKE